jgi:hypothetical protein
MSLMVILLAFVAYAAQPGDKRTILTSGERVHTIHYQLGQSTVLYFGMRPETVICGNNNYFHIEKIKEGLTIQPLSSFSTNLTVMNQGRRFLFYLTPAKSGSIDTFIDVRWIPEAESRPVAVVGFKSTEVVRDISQKMRVGIFELNLKREIDLVAVHRSIVEFEVKNLSKEALKTSALEILALKFGRPLDHQILVFEQDELKPGSSGSGRLIVTGADFSRAVVVANYLGKSGKVFIKGGSH